MRLQEKKSENSRPFFFIGKFFCDDISKVVLLKYCDVFGWHLN